MTLRRGLVLAGAVLALAAVVVVGPAAQPAPAHGDVSPQTYCTCVWDATRHEWCYRCCDVYGCYDLYCDPGGC
jgi:hypothetical protein